MHMAQSNFNSRMHLIRAFFTKRIHRWIVVPLNLQFSNNVNCGACSNNAASSFDFIIDSLAEFESQQIIIGNCKSMAQGADGLFVVNQLDL